MEWNHLFSTKRLGSSNTKQSDDLRGEFMRDYDRIIFSAEFKDLQNKAQTFPLHSKRNRLTHALEVASIGRSLGKNVGFSLAEKYWTEWSSKELEFYKFDLPYVIQTACLAAELGGFYEGKSAELAIQEVLSKYHKNYPSKIPLDFCTAINSSSIAFHTATSIFLKNGLKLTYTTLASMVRNPSVSGERAGILATDLSAFQEICDELAIPCLQWENQTYARHPYSLLVEAADHICTSIRNIEEAYLLGYTEYRTAIHTILSLNYKPEQKAYLQSLAKEAPSPKNLAIFRSFAIQSLIEACTETFIKNESKILQGKFLTSLIQQTSQGNPEAFVDILTFFERNVLKKQELLDHDLKVSLKVKQILEHRLEILLENPESRLGKRLEGEPPQEKLVDIILHSKF